MHVLSVRPSTSYVTGPIQDSNFVQISAEQYTKRRFKVLSYRFRDNDLRCCGMHSFATSAKHPDANDRNGKTQLPVPYSSPPALAPFHMESAEPQR